MDDVAEVRAAEHHGKRAEISGPCVATTHAIIVNTPMGLRAMMNAITRSMTA